MSEAPKVNPGDLTPDQKHAIALIGGQMAEAIAMVIPQTTQHLRTGGVITINTMSGMSLKIGWQPTTGGIITPGGINPAAGQIIKPFN